MNAVRSLLFVPGNRPDMLDKALTFKPDAYVPDLEDSVPASQKEQGRRIVASYLPALKARGCLVIPRLNSLHSDLLEDDLEAVIGPHVHAIAVGKVETDDDVDAISALMDHCERAVRVNLGTTRLIPWIETALGVVHAYEICQSSPRVMAVAFGAEDFTLDMGIERSDDESELAYARQAVCVAARAAGIPALDTPFFRFRDADGLRANTLAARRCGFKGKFAIHPAQLEIIHQSFAPTDAEIAHARRVLAAYEEAERDGRGATSLDGKVIDEPVVKRARAVLNNARGREAALNL